MKGVMKQLVAEELATLVLIEELLDDILRLSHHNAQSEIRSAMYNVREQIMLDLLRKEIIGETLGGHVAKLLDTDAAINRLSKELLTSSLFVALIVTFVQLENGSAIADQNTVLATASKKKLLASMEEYGDIIEKGAKTIVLRKRRTPLQQLLRTPIENLLCRK